MPSSQWVVGLGWSGAGHGSLSSSAEKPTAHSSTQHLPHLPGAGPAFGVRGSVVNTMHKMPGIVVGEEQELRGKNRTDREYSVLHGGKSFGDTTAGETQGVRWGLSREAPSSPLWGRTPRMRSGREGKEVEANPVGPAFGFFSEIWGRGVGTGEGLEQT